MFVVCLFWKALPQSSLWYLAEIEIQHSSKVLKKELKKFPLKNLLWYSVLKILAKLFKDGSVHWTAKVGGDKTKDTQQYFYQPRPVDVEMSSYALLTYMLNDDTEKGLPVVRWLTSQRNALGGFSSTQVSHNFSWLVRMEPFIPTRPRMNISIFDWCRCI